MAHCTAQTLLNSSHDYQGFTPRQLEIFKAALLCRILKTQNPMASCEIADLMEAGKCFDCATPHQLQVIQTQLLCEVLHAGGGSGTSCIFCGNADPTEEPACDCAVAINVVNGNFWYWDGIQWVLLIGTP